MESPLHIREHVLSVRPHVRALRSLLLESRGIRNQHASPYSDPDKLLQAAGTILGRTLPVCKAVINGSDTLVASACERLSSVMAPGEDEAQLPPEERALVAEARAASASAVSAFDAFRQALVDLTLVSLQGSGILSPSELKQTALIAAEWLKVAALDATPWSGLITKGLETILGVDLEEKLWHSWADSLRRKRSIELLDRCNLAVVITMRYANFALDIARITDEGLSELESIDS